MFKKMSHIEGLKEDVEILFSTPFDYFFPAAARSKLCLLPVSEATLEALRKLADFMVDGGQPAAPLAQFDSDIPAIFTYFGQFIDHDLTARTDRDSEVSSIGRGELILPLDPDDVISHLRNGRRPTLDLDSVFGDGPGLANGATTQSQELYEADFRLNVIATGGGFDLPRKKAINLEEDISYPAVIADMRNDENIVISQLQTAFIKFYNAIYAVQNGSAQERYSRSRQLACWAYQYVVIHDYLKKVCVPAIVDDTLRNGPRFIGASAGRTGLFMPLEFSTAAFRFGHSMIRPFYKLNDISGDLKIMNLLRTSETAANFDGFDPLDPDAKQLIDGRLIDWNNFVGPNAQKARKIDTKISQGLFDLGDPLKPAFDPILKHLARRNLFRAYNLSIPTGQAMCDAFGVDPLTSAEICADANVALKDLLTESYFDQRTPLWYYVLRESAVQEEGNRLGELGSRIVCETIINLIKQDPNSYLNHLHHPAVAKVDGEASGIRIGEDPDDVVSDLAGILRFAGVLVPQLNPQEDEAQAVPA